MKFKYMVMAGLILAIFMIGAVSATDTISEDIVSDEDDIPLEITDNEVYTTGESSFSNLTDEIEKTGMYLDLNQDYAFNNETDNKKGITIAKDNFVLNGNGHTIDAKNQSRIFNITANNVTLSNLILTGGNAEKGGAIYAIGSLTLNNVTFTNNYAKMEGGAVGLYSDVTITCANSKFIDNYAEAGSAIYIKKGELNLYNAELSSKIFNKYSQIAALKNSTLYIENSTFANTSSSYSPALYVRGSKTSIINSKFNNLKANITAGAIGVRLGGEIYIKNCEFINTTSSKNAGAVYADIAGDGNGGNVTILDSIFKDTYSDFGGAFLQLGGDLLLNNTEFINNHATYNGGSVYLSCVNGKINNCTFTSNSVDVIEGYPTYGGAILLDMGTYNISKSKFFNNNASAGAAIYAYDSAYTISNSIFENNTNPIYSVFDKQSNIDESNTFINDNNISTNNTFYATIIVGEGMQLTLINNTINVTTLPSRYDSRDWGWVSSVKAQGWMGSCWTFGMTGALESALLKATGLKIDLSENNMQDTMIKYSIYGETEMVEGAINTLAASYLLSWFGAFTEDLDSYDEMGKISPVITTTQDIHVQDVIFIANDEVPNGTKLKEAIMKYGSINVNYYGQSQYDEVSLYYNTETYAQYVDVPTPQNHAVTVVGWDDNFPKEKFLSTPPGDGAWIVKNSWGPAWGENGYLYVSYYDQSFVQCGPGELNGHATAVILENTVPYNKNYQYVVAWDGSFLPGAETVSYMNVFEALDDDLIAAVGTFFQEGGDNYTVEIYVNDELKLTQNGVTPYIGYHTIKLNEYIPVKEGDVFKAVITTKNIPFMKLENMRTHYTSNISFVSIDGAPWIDSYYEGVIAVLKVYTVDEDVKQNTTLVAPNRTIGVNDAIYGYDYQFILKDENGTALANKEVQVSFNGKNPTVTTDDNGWGTARVKADTEGTYDVEITFEGDNDYNGISQSATIKLIRQKTSFVAPDRTVYVRDMSRGYSYSAILKDNYGKPLANKKVLFIFNGEKQVAFTDENGWTTVTIKADVAGTQTVTIKFAGDRCYQETTITKTIKIVRESSKMTVPETTYKTTDAKQVTATLKSKSENPIYGAKVTITVDGKTYDATTDSNGIAKFSIDINKLGIFSIAAKFDDSRFYAATTTTSKINII